MAAADTLQAAATVPRPTKAVLVYENDAEDDAENDASDAFLDTEPADDLIPSLFANSTLIQEFKQAGGDASAQGPPTIILTSEAPPSWKNVADICNRRIQHETRSAVLDATLQSKQMNSAMQHVFIVRDFLYGTSWAETKALIGKHVLNAAVKIVDTLVKEPRDEEDKTVKIKYEDFFAAEFAGGSGEHADDDRIGGSARLFVRDLDIFDPYNVPTVKLQHKQEGQDVIENWNAEYDLYYSQMDRVAKSRYMKSTIRQRFKQGAISDTKAAERQAAMNEMGDVPRLRLQFRVESSASSGKDDILYLGIMEAKDLPGKGVGRTRANPYCKVNFKPKKMPTEIQTRMKLNTVNPVWKEIVQIAGFPLAVIKRQTLVVRVFDKDELVYDELLGEVHVAMSKYTITQGKIDEWFTLRNLPESHMPKPKGKIRLGIVYDNVANDLAISVLKVKELGGKKKKKKTTKPLLWLLFRYRRRKRKRRGKSGDRAGDDFSRYIIVTKLRRIVNHEVQVLSEQRHVLLRRSALAHGKSNFPIQLLYEDMRPSDLIHSFFTAQVVERYLMFFYRAVGEITLSVDSRDKAATQHWRDIEANPGELFTRWHTLVATDPRQDQDDE